jgi:sulfonate transport system substrate-binding protein
MQRRQLLKLLAATPALPLARAADAELVVAVNQTTIESAPFFVRPIPGIRVVPVPNGRAASAQLVSGMVDAATGSETQALLNSIAQPQLRIVLTLCECRYRIVARRSAGISSIADLRGKRVAHTPGTSSQYYLVDMLRLAGLTVSDVTLITLEGPEMPAALANKTIDAMAMWEPHAQNALNQLGGDDMVLTHPNSYFERFNLNTTTAVLDDPQRRAVLVNALRAIEDVSRELTSAPKPFLPTLSQTISTPTSIIEQVWSQFTFPARLQTEPLLSMLEQMEPWAANVAQREPRSRATLAQMIDASAASDA